MLKLNAVKYNFEDFTLGPLNLELKKDSIIAVMGESGCGKSTLLELIYGLRDLNEGQIFWNDKKVLGPAYNLVPGAKNMNYLAQHDQLMPYSSVASNIQKFISRQEPKKSNQVTSGLLDLIDMKDYRGREVKTLSGGQKQRVALAQILASRPQLLLLDEPFNFIDTFQRVKLRRHILDYLKREKIPCIYATHDSADVLGFADKILVLKNGIKMAFEKTEQLFKTPETFYTASLFGEVNLCEAQLFDPEKKGGLMLYPEDIQRSKKKGVQAEVKKCYFQGSQYLIEAKILKTRQIINFISEKKLKFKAKIELELRDKNLIDYRLVKN